MSFFACVFAQSGHLFILSPENNLLVNGAVNYNKAIDLSIYN